jgi:hypothetical protein
LLFFDILVRQ